jgi:hypothetical protein
VFAFAARQGEIAQTLLSGGRSAVGRIAIRAQTGICPHIGAGRDAAVCVDEERQGVVAR